MPKYRVVWIAEFKENFNDYMDTSGFIRDFIRDIPESTWMKRALRKETYWDVNEQNTGWDKEPMINLVIDGFTEVEAEDEIEAEEMVTFGPMRDEGATIEINSVEEIK